MINFRKLFRKKCAVIGMVHVKALPGTPQYQNNIEKIISHASKETEIYLKNELDAIMIENMHDIPYVQSKHFGPEIVATMSRVCTEIRKIVPLTTPCGIQVLSCGNKEAIAISKACNFNFIRAEGFVFGHIGDEGYTDANGGNLLRYRKMIGADDVLVLTDIKKKHSSHAITNDVTLEETAKAAEFFLSDGLILTGTATGMPAKVDELSNLRKSTKLPILVGSGVTEANLENYFEADGLIVGSDFKNGGVWSETVDEERVKKFMGKIRTLRIN
ncbi:uncharacterized protein F13E9.13, mitochondrial [Anthonomus grandis grandis]|uniref:uncharacterized protein F13E9.13, mitochondrial n=1 Tax=Anthonomus grandis grandis TaxID=2921223 RepID=UPI0021659092|nr:uncharacterized protein F13E9.13, mitochondrial [Anthonomus grandis grandis]